MKLSTYWPNYTHRVVAFLFGAFVTFLGWYFPFLSVVLYPFLMWFWWAFVVSTFLNIKYVLDEFEVKPTPLFAAGENAGGERVP